MVVVGCVCGGGSPHALLPPPPPGGLRRRRALLGVRGRGGPGGGYIKGGGRGSGRDAQDGRAEEFTLRRQRAPLALAAGLAGAAGRAREGVPPGPACLPAPALSFSVPFSSGRLCLSPAFGF